ncbi:hypothetical protein [Bacillus sp. J33]|uniref:hypothetical protein n=1 Tax=Bacillus sp. J33 TaxID=935836 RepID=UPI00047CAF43|nr:hypothetical protein [Bacillus sp. J33]
MGIKVQLKHDLTRYHPQLTNGAVGHTTHLKTINDCFVKVYFPGAGHHDILWKSIEIIDEEYLEKRKKESDEKMKAIKENGKVELHWKKSGYLSSLRYEYRIGNQDFSHSIGFLDLAATLYEDFRNNGIEIKEFGEPNDVSARKFGESYHLDRKRTKAARNQSIISNGKAVAEWCKIGGFVNLKINYTLNGTHHEETIIKRDKGIARLNELIQAGVPVTHLGKPAYKNRVALNMI